MEAGDFVGPKVDIEVVLSLKSKTPVVGCEINPSVRVNGYGSGLPPPHTLHFSWLVLISSQPVCFDTFILWYSCILCLVCSEL